jgi:hypothetical protein
MDRFFNIAGPVRKEMHYCIEPLDRIDLVEIQSLIHQEKYFVFHAPRQSTGDLALSKKEVSYKGQIIHVYGM